MAYLALVQNEPKYKTRESSIGNQGNLVLLMNSRETGEHIEKTQSPQSYEGRRMARKLKKEVERKFSELREYLDLMDASFEAVRKSNRVTPHDQNLKDGYLGKLLGVTSALQAYNQAVWDDEFRELQAGMEVICMNERRLLSKSLNPLKKIKLKHLSKHVGKENKPNRRLQVI